MITDLETNISLNEALATFYKTSQFRLENFTYSNDLILENIFNHLTHTHFKGLTVSLLLQLKI